MGKQLVEIPARHLKPGDKVFNTWSRGVDEVFGTSFDDGIYHIEYRGPDEREDYLSSSQTVMVLIDVEKLG